MKRTHFLKYNLNQPHDFLGPDSDFSMFGITTGALPQKFLVLEKHAIHFNFPSELQFLQHF